MTSREASVHCPGSVCAAVPRRPAYRGRFMQPLGRGLLLGVLSLALSLGGMAGCSGPGTAAHKASVGSLFSSPSGDSQAERQALKKAVDKDPFPKAKSRALDPEA